MKKTLLSLVVGLSLVGCASTSKVEQKEEVTVKPAVPLTPTQEELAGLPSWFIAPPVEKGKIFAVGTSSAPDLQLSIDLALTNAETTLADILNGRISSQTKTYVSKVGTGDASSSVSAEAEKVTKKMTNDVDISGWSKRDVKIQAVGNQYRTYVLIEYSLQTKTTSQVDKSKAAKAFDDLNKPAAKPVEEKAAPVVSSTEVKPLQVDNPEYVARRDEAIKRGAVIIQKIIE